jgi:hypothetical protein
VHPLLILDPTGDAEAQALEAICFDSCPDATPDACGPSTCVNFKIDKNNCGGCGNVCPSESCNNGTCDPGFCGTFKATAWNGTVTETNTDLCGGTANLSLAGTTSTFTLAPSSTVPRGCDVSGNLLLAQGGDSICGIWSGLWTCGGTVNGSGAMALTCSCLTNMPASGTFSANTYSGGWSFSASGQDDNGDTVTDNATGSILLNRQ